MEPSVLQSFSFFLSGARGCAAAAAGRENERGRARHVAAGAVMEEELSPPRHAHEHISHL